MLWRRCGLGADGGAVREENGDDPLGWEKDVVESEDRDVFEVQLESLREGERSGHWTECERNAHLLIRAFLEKGKLLHGASEHDSSLMSEVVLRVNLSWEVSKNRTNGTPQVNSPSGIRSAREDTPLRLMPSHRQMSSPLTRLTIQTRCLPCGSRWIAMDAVCGSVSSLEAVPAGWKGRTDDRSRSESARRPLRSRYRIPGGSLRRTAALLPALEGPFESRKCR